MNTKVAVSTLIDASSYAMGVLAGAALFVLLISVDATAAAGHDGSGGLTDVVNEDRVEQVSPYTTAIGPDKVLWAGLALTKND